jgi:hypothetical protein
MPIHVTISVTSLMFLTSFTANRLFEKFRRAFRTCSSS